MSLHRFHHCASVVSFGSFELPRREPLDIIIQPNKDSIITVSITLAAISPSMCLGIFIVIESDSQPPVFGINMLELNCEEMTLVTIATYVFDAIRN